MNTPTLQDWLWIEVMFIHAMIGAISSNFRQVALSFRNKRWILVVTLEKDDAEDREEISEIVDEFSILLEDIKDKISSPAYVKSEAVVEVFGTDIKLKTVQDNKTRMLYRRKETFKE